ncbi:MAG TPA: universal stress protein [Casimicrobiaceae bacterium]|nr:universal stress protein [Casimicrobiaceae bacterium]
MFRKILVPIDGSPPARRGLEEAILLAKDQSASIRLLHVLDESAVTRAYDGTTYLPASYVDDLMRNLTAAGSKLIKDAAAKARQRRVKVEGVLLEAFGRRVADVIVAEAKKWSADVIVLGTHGRAGLSRVVLGSDAELVVRESPCPVLLVRGKVTAAGTRKATKRR